MARFQNLWTIQTSIKRGNLRLPGSHQNASYSFSLRNNSSWSKLLQVLPKLLCSLSSSRSRVRYRVQGWSEKNPDSYFSGIRTKPCHAQGGQEEYSKSEHVHSSVQQQSDPPSIYVQQQPQQQQPRVQNNTGIYLQTMPCANSHFTGLCV